MPKEYRLPHTLFAKRVSSAVVRFDVVQTGDQRHGRFILACGHTQDTRQLVAPVENFQIVCRICSGMIERDYSTKVLGVLGKR